MGKMFWKRLFNVIVNIEFPVCFTIAKHENDMLSSCETTNVFIDASPLLRNSFPSVRTVRIDKNNNEIYTCLARFISSMELLSKG